MRLWLTLYIFMLIIPTSFSATPRIINGKKAQEGNWPWMVAIIYTHRSSIENGQFCGGTLVHPYWVLTAAHCTLDETIDSIEVVLGHHNLSQLTEEAVIGIETIIRHPQYDRHPLNPSHDLALLKLKKPAQQPVLQVIEHYEKSIQPGLLATVIGWGQTNTKNRDSYSETLRQTEVPIVSNQACQDPYPNDINESMLCAGFFEGGTDACIGDSGGPLVVETEQGWRQIGIVSWGEGCALPSYYGVYTRLTLFQEFISQTICESEDPLPRPQLQIDIQNQSYATARWNPITQAAGYQFYYAPYSAPLDDSTLNHIHSLILGSQTDRSAYLNPGAKWYVAVKAYRGNCYSPWSNIAAIMIPESFQ